MAGINNKYDYRDGVLTALEVEHTPSDLRNEDEYRKKVLNGLGVEYTDDDINQKNLFREKVVSGLSSGGGGGGGDFTTANVTVNDPNALGMLVNGAFPVEGTLGCDFPYIEYAAFSDEFDTGKVALYKGNALIDVEIPDEGTITVSGNAEIIMPGRIKVTGDCTITIS